MLNMLKTFASHLIASALAAAVGAVVGSLIARDTTLKNTRIQAVMSAYATYLPEADYAVSVAGTADFDEGGEDRFRRTTNVLAVYASDDIRCRALRLQDNIMNQDPRDDLLFGDMLYRSLIYWEFLVMASAIRNEVRGEVSESSMFGECIWPPEEKAAEE